MSVNVVRDVFDTPPLPVATVEELKALALATATQVVDLAYQSRHSSTKWSVVSEESGLRIFKGIDPDALPGINLHCGAIQIQGAIDEVVQLMRTDTEEHAQLYKQRFGKDVKENVTMYTLEAPKLETPNHLIGITWMAFRSPLRRVVSNRDVCVLECHREFTIRGRRGWVRAVRSITLPGCPDLEKSHGYVRMINHGSGHVFLESLDKPGYIDMAYVTQVDMRVGRSEWAVDALNSRDFLIEKAIIRRCQSLLEIDRFLQQTRGKNGALMDTKATSRVNSRRKFCCICDKRFGPLSKKINCTKCPQAMCRRCDQQWRSTTQSSMSLCTSCALDNDTPTEINDSQRARNTDETCVSNVGSAISSDEASDIRDDVLSRTYQPSFLYKNSVKKGFVLVRSGTTQVFFE